MANAYNHWVIISNPGLHCFVFFKKRSDITICVWTHCQAAQPKQKAPGSVKDNIGYILSQEYRAESGGEKILHVFCRHVHGHIHIQHTHTIIHTEKALRCKLIFKSQALLTAIHLRYVPITMGQKLSSKVQLSLPPKVFTMPGVKQVDLWAFKALVYTASFKVAKAT